MFFYIRFKSYYIVFMPRISPRPHTGEQALSLFALPANGTYLGCYKDSPNNRSLPDKLADSFKMTPEMCQMHAAFEGYTYFAVQGSGELGPDLRILRDLNKYYA